MTRQEVIELAEKISTGVASDWEIAQYNRWYQTFQEDNEEWSTAELGDEGKIEDELLRRFNLMTDLPALELHNRSSIYFLRRIAAAVIILVLAAGSTYWYFSGMSQSRDFPELVIQNDVPPGGDKATLLLGDGSRIMLDEVNAGLLANEGNTIVNKSEEGLITYHTGQGANEARGNNLQKTTYNTISTPEGGKYRVILPDESEVWLNAMSSIRFPTRFNADKREVEITGEVYFDVTPNEHQPFWVRSRDQVVKVLGTQFNIHAYSDEEAILTTLVEGSVVVESENIETRIAPGQQTINHNNAVMEVKEVDTEQVIAWKNGLFQFWDTDLHEIMRQLSRWYGVKVNYLNDGEGSSFTGFISRDVTISNVLRMLEEAGNVQFGLEGNRVSVKTGRIGNEK